MNEIMRDADNKPITSMSDMVERASKKAKNNPLLRMNIFQKLYRVVVDTLACLALGVGPYDSSTALTDAKMSAQRYSGKRSVAVFPDVSRRVLRAWCMCVESAVHTPVVMHVYSHVCVCMCVNVCACSWSWRW